MTRISIHEETVSDLREHGRIPISYEVRRTLHVEAVEVGRYRLTERDVAVPYVKDYDSDGDPPARSVAAFNLTNWVLLVAQVEAERAGGAVLVFDTPDVDMLEGRRDLAVVWDLRVAPPYRNQGVGCALWRAAVRWASIRGCRQIKVETQDVNVPACRFYTRQGCHLGRAVPGAYPDLPHETQLLWYAEVPPAS